ncbi:MAG TPA: hypothetical protein PKC43_14240 [Phycisphaerales bacterium]|nr:hypothetical protein [Phycisphaerales bacterium]HMP38593.1 hypothetical protein [Phycisphaerales bacterium]
MIPEHASNNAPERSPLDALPTIGTIAQGMRFDGSDPEALAAALDLAMDYRGDVTVVLRDGRRIEGFIFDRVRRVPRSIRLLPRESDEHAKVADDEIAILEVTGRDTAAGKTFENWVRRYVEKKLAGERASIESESLEE